MKPIRMIELFAGIGACSKAVKNLGIPVELVDVVELDKYAMTSFNAIHQTNFSCQDIRKWDKDLPAIDLLTHTSPCQDFSVGGRQAGADPANTTRSSLMYESIRIIGKLRPTFVLWENVKNVTSKRHKKHVEKYLATMEEWGYHHAYGVLNARDFDIPQQRERFFILSWLDKTFSYSFPTPLTSQPFPPLHAFLEKEVAPKYVLSEQMHQKYVAKNATRGYIAQNTQASQVYDDTGIFTTICAGSHGYANGYVRCTDLLRTQPNQSIRKLTPRETFRLMGFSATDFSQAQHALQQAYYNGKDRADTQLYKQAGNSIVVPVLETIFQPLTSYFQQKGGDTL